MTRKRFYLENYGDDTETLHYAMNYVVKNLYAKSYVIVINNMEYKANLVDMKFINHENIHSFEFNGINFQIQTVNQILKTHLFDNALIISLWLDSETLFKIEDKPGIENIIAIPCNDTSLQLWKDTYGPIDLISNERINCITISDVNLKKGFDDLNNQRINWSTLCKFDLQQIKSLIKQNTSNINPQEIFAYLMREKHLNFRRSNEIMKWSNDLKNGKNVKTK